MKKIICMIMTVLMVFALVACGNQNSNPTEPENTPVVDNTTTDDTNIEDTNTPDEDVSVDMPTEDNGAFTYAEELAVALVSQTGSVAPVATSRVNLADAAAVKEATGIEDISKIKNVAVAESVDVTKPFKFVIVIFVDEAAASNSAEAMKTTLASVGDSCMSVAIKNYAIVVAMNAGDSDTVSVQGICDEFVAMMADESNIYFPTRHLDEEPPVDVETPENETADSESEEVVEDDVNDETESETPAEDNKNTEG